MKRAVRSTDKFGWQLLVISWVAISVLFSLLPLYITILNSLKAHIEIQRNIFAFPSFSLSVIGDNYSSAFMQTWRPMLNSVFVSLVGAFFNMVLGAIMAYIFSRKDFFGKEFFFKLYIIILLVPSIMGMPVLYELMDSGLNLKDSYFAIWLPVIGGGQAGALFLFRTFFVQQPASIFESAKLDGANDFHIFIQLVVPLALPILLLNFTGTFSGQYNDFMWPALIIPLQEKRTLMPVIQTLVENLDSMQKRGAQYAIYVISSVPLIITTTLSLKHFQSGDFAAGMKM